MSDLIIEERADYIRFTMPENKNRELSKQMWKEIKETLDEKEIKKGLLINETEKKPYILDFFMMFPYFKSLGFDSSFKGAYVEKESTKSSMLNLAEKYMVKKGFSNYRTFNDEEEAISWLKEN